MKVDGLKVEVELVQANLTLAAEAGSGDMTKAVFAANGATGVVDKSVLAEQVPYSGITGLPASFPPSAHAASHVSGSDQISLASDTAAGLCPPVDNSTIKVQNGKLVATAQVPTVDGSTIVNTAGTLSVGTVPYSKLSGTPTIPTVPTVDGTTITDTNNTLSVGSVPYSKLTGTPSIPAADGTTIKNTAGVLSVNSVPYSDLTGAPTIPTADGSTITENGSGVLSVGTVPYTKLSGTPTIPTVPGVDGTTIVDVSNTLSVGTVPYSKLSGTPTIPVADGTTIKNTAGTLSVNQVPYSSLTGTPQIPVADGSTIVNTSGTLSVPIDGTTIKVQGGQLVSTASGGSSLSADGKTIINTAGVLSAPGITTNTSAITALQKYARKAFFEINEDFINGNGTLTYLNAGTASNSGAQYTNPVPGVCGVTSISTSGGTATLSTMQSSLASTGFKLTTSSIVYNRWKIMIPVLSTSTTNFTVMAGIVGQMRTVAPSLGGIYFSTNAVSSPDWFVQIRNTTVSTSLDTGIAVVAGAFYDLEILTDGTNVNFTITPYDPTSGAKGSSSTFQISQTDPNFPVSNAQGLSVGISMNSGTAQSWLHVDKLRFYNLDSQ